MRFLLRHGATAPREAARELGRIALHQAHAASGRPERCCNYGTPEEATETVRVLEAKSCAQCGTVGRVKCCAR